jgi:hypothetical protein
MFGIFCSTLLLPLVSAYFALPDPQTDHSGRGIFEVDLVFPREGTFSPTNSTPIIFAVQNPQRAADLGAYINWVLIQTSNKTRPNSYSPPGQKQEGQISLQSINVSTVLSNPYLAWDRITAIGDTEDIWEFDWTIRYRNCTEFSTERNTTVVGIEYAQSSYGINFTTQRTASQPASLVTALANNTCRVGDYFAVNVTMWEPLPGSEGDKYCSELGDTPTAENHNCFIGDEAKKAVMDQFAYLACMDTFGDSLGSNCTEPGKVATKAPASVKPSMAIRGVRVPMFWFFVAMFGLGVLIV